MGEFKLIAFKRKIPTCPKCLGVCSRRYCNGDELFTRCHNEGEHLDIVCGECGFTFYQQVVRLRRDSGVEGEGNGR